MQHNNKVRVLVYNGDQPRYGEIAYSDIEGYFYVTFDETGACERTNRNHVWVLDELLETN